ncbi:MAG: hypothetical protein MUD07_07160 [Burkholderiaceae bacterium]|nr:hypothetical protein [Burkholderiaceae bacterium]
MARSAGGCLVSAGGRLGGMRELLELCDDRLVNATLPGAALVFGLARARAGLEHRIAGKAEAVPQRALVTLRQDDRLRVRLPARLQFLHARRRVALGGLRREPLGLRNQRHALRLGLGTRRVELRVQGGQRGLQACLELLPDTRIDTAQRLVAPGSFGVAQPAFERTPVARLSEQRRRMGRRGGDELLALLARLLVQRRLLGEVPRRRGVGALAGAVEALPQRLRHAGMLLVELLPLRAQLLHLTRQLQRRQRLCQQGLGALGKLHARGLLSEVLPAFELDELLHDATESLHARLRQLAGRHLQSACAVGSGAGRLQLARRQRLLGLVQGTVQFEPGRSLLLLAGADHRQPALLDHQQGGLETS